MVSGMYPFGAGVAVAGLAIVALQRGRRILAAAAIFAVPAFSPLAFLLLLVVLGAALITAASPRLALRTNRWPAAAVGCALVAAAALKVAFGGTGYYPFSAVDLATALGFSIAGVVLARVAGHRRHLDGCAKLLASLSYQGVLQRGYALVRDSEGRALRSAAQIAAGQRIDIELADGRVDAQALSGGAREGAKSQPPTRAAPTRGCATPWSVHALR